MFLSGCTVVVSLTCAVLSLVARLAGAHVGAGRVDAVSAVGARVLLKTLVDVCVRHEHNTHGSL